jgi:hypothetical protein
MLRWAALFPLGRAPLCLSKRLVLAEKQQYPRPDTPGGIPCGHSDRLYVPVVRIPEGFRRDFDGVTCYRLRLKASGSSEAPNLSPAVIRKEEILGPENRNRYTHPGRTSMG